MSSAYSVVTHKHPAPHHVVGLPMFELSKFSSMSNVLRLMLPPVFERFPQDVQSFFTGSTWLQAWRGGWESLSD